MGTSIGDLGEFTTPRVQQAAVGEEEVSPVPDAPADQSSGGGTVTGTDDKAINF